MKVDYDTLTLFKRVEVYKSKKYARIYQDESKIKYLYRA